VWGELGAGLPQFLQGRSLELSRRGIELGCVGGSWGGRLIGQRWIGEKKTQAGRSMEGWMIWGREPAVQSRMNKENELLRHTLL
jgi:hypothetical protein